MGAEERDGGQSRYDRELIELLNELRVALPGVQVLFAFLLAVPFTQRWADVTSFQESVYFVTLMLAAGATLLLIAPSALHRIRFRRHDKRYVLSVANRFTVAGLALLAAAMTGAILLIADLLFGRTQAFVVAGVTALLFAAVWFALPLGRRLNRDEGAPGGRGALAEDSS